MRDPKGFKSATKHLGWTTTMDDEIQALQQNQTWDLVPWPTHKNVVGSKWVSRVKYLSKGFMDRLKA